MSEKLHASKKKGAHALLARMAGTWRGTARTWFEPGQLGETSPVNGAIRLVLNGMFAQHSYRGKLMGQSMQGLALIGFSLGEQQWQVAWINSVHNGTRIMHSVGKKGASPLAPEVVGSYPAGDGPDWGWRTTLQLKGRDRLLLRHFNVTPQGEESIGVEFDYRRVKASPKPRPKSRSRRG